MRNSNIFLFIPTKNRIVVLATLSLALSTSAPTAMQLFDGCQAGLDSGNRDIVLALCTPDRIPPHMREGNTRESESLDKQRNEVRRESRSPDVGRHVSDNASWRYYGPGCAPNLMYLRSQVPYMARQPGVEEVLAQDIDAAIRATGLDRALVSMRIQRDEYIKGIQQAKACADELAPGGRGGVYPRVTGEPQGARDACLVSLQINEEGLLLHNAMISAYECRRGR